MNEVHEIWEVKVQRDKKPYSYEKIRRIGTVNHSKAVQIHEKAMKHMPWPYEVFWMCVSDEKELGVAPKTFIIIEGFKP